MNPTIERLATASQEMSAEEAGSVLARSREFVVDAILHGHLESLQPSGRGTGANRRYTISKAALLAYIVRSTSGDRVTLMAAIETLLPMRLQQLAQRIAKANPHEAPELELPANVIPMPRKPKGTEDPYKGHPELFPAAVQAVG